MPVEAKTSFKPQRVARAEADRSDVRLAEEKASEIFRLRGGDGDLVPVFARIPRA
jgi:hypothetical protein